MRLCLLLFTLCWFLSSFLSSCKKEDDIAPVVSILQPLEGTIYAVFDTVSVSVSAVDETALVSVTAKLVNGDFIPIGGSANVVINSNTGNGAAELVISNKLTETGDYYVLVTASDGTNEKREYKKIRITGLPKERRAIYFSSNGNGTGSIWKLDSLFNNAIQWVMPGQDVKKVGVNSLRDRITVIGNYSTGIKNYDLVSGAVAWSDNVFPLAQTQRFNDVICYGNDVFTSIYDREIRKYNLAGGLTFNQPTGIYRPETIYVDERYMLVEVQLVGDNDHFLVVYNAATNGFLWQLDVPMDIVSICELEDHKVLLFGNEAGNARVLHYDIDNNAYWEPRQLPTGKVHKAEKMNGQMFAIAHANGLYAYTYSPNYLNLIRGGIVYQDLCYDLDNGTIIGATYNSLEEIGPNGQLLNTSTQSDSITSIAIHYTR